MKIAYQNINFRETSLDLITTVNQIVDEYKHMGYDLTLRQVYYQMVARDIIPNNERSYKNIGNLISDGRLAGLIDWDAIEDRTRNLRSSPHWDSPQDIVMSCARQFAYDKWEGQEKYVEVWVEKDALIGVVGQACKKLDVPHFSCRGYVSQSEMWVAAQRLIRQVENDRAPVIIHLGDHDPSGKDMSRDIVDRLEIFGICPEFNRIALNWDQIEEYAPPPNPAKLTDSRASGYINEFGAESWELDALRPDVLDELILTEIEKHIYMPEFRKQIERENEARRELLTAAHNWDKVIKSI